MGQYVFNYSGATYCFPKDENDKEKYIVFACAKNEDPYIREWTTHYLSLGFDKVIIADNNDSPDSLKGILSDLIRQGKVQIFECNGLKKFQLYIYNMFLSEGNYKWCAYFDCDEFLVLNVHKDIKHFLNGINEDCVLINWIVFGSNGELHKKDLPIQTRFKVPVSPLPFFKENFYVKPIIRGGAKGLWLTNTHCPLSNEKRTFNIGGYATVDYSSHVYFPPRCKYAYIKHYYTKSFDEWISGKIKRGWPDEMFDVLKPTNYFIADSNTEFPINKFVNGFFVDNKTFSKEGVEKSYGKAMEEYEVIVAMSSDNNPYAIVLNVFSLMKYYTDHIFVINADCVDDSLFNEMLEYAFITGNRLCFAANQEEIFSIILNKAKRNKELYYYIDFQ